MFEDTIEIDHVIYLLRGYAECAKHPLSPKELKTVRANSVLIVLEEKLRAALIATGLPDIGVDKLAYLYTLTALQRAYADALKSVRSAPDPGDWTEMKIEEFNRQLLEIHSIDGDRARSADATTKRGRSKGGEKGAIEKKKQAADRDNNLKTEAEKLRATNSKLSYLEIARRLNERDADKYGSIDGIRRKLSRLLKVPR